MASIEKKITHAILTMIRKRRHNTVARDTSNRSQTLSPVPAVKLREAQFSDFDAIAALKLRWGLAPDSPENWKRMWVRNPALNAVAIKPAIGWVLESEGGLVGYLGNVSLPYHYAGKTLIAVTGSGLVVEPAYRAVSLTLLAAYYRQKSVDLFLTTTAIETVGKIARAFKSDPLPQPEYDTVLFWVLKPYPFAQAVIKRLKLNSTFAYLGAIFTAFAVAADGVMRRRPPRRVSKKCTVNDIRVHEIGDDFQNLWAEKLSEAKGKLLLADRSPAVLRWHFDIPGDHGVTRVLCCRLNGRLRGYAVVRTDSNTRNGLRRTLIADMLVINNDPVVVRALFASAYGHAKSARSEVLEVMGFPDEIRRVLYQSNPYSRKYPACPFYYKAVDPELHKSLADGAAWYASPYDGDTTLVPSSSSSRSAAPAAGMRIEDSDGELASDVSEHEHTEVL